VLTADCDGAAADQSASVGGCSNVENCDGKLTCGDCPPDDQCDVKSYDWTTKELCAVCTDNKGNSGGETCAIGCAQHQNCNGVVVCEDFDCQAGCTPEPCGQAGSINLCPASCPGGEETAQSRVGCQHHATGWLISEGSIHSD